jgi:2-dehydro-3-deoxy-D-gluconate 5-dehydrogenase
MHRLFEISGNKAIVTGGAAGLGRGMVEALHDAGVEVAIIDISDEVSKVAGDITQKGPPVHAVHADLAKREDVKRAFEEALGTLGGRVDLLINDAGAQKRHKCEDFPIEDWDLVLEVNLSAVFQMCQLAGRVMLAQGRGKIINVASMLSYSGGVTVPAYAASKGGVAQLTKALANEWAPRGINVNAIAPGWMATALTAALVGNPQREPDILARIPAGRWGHPADLQGAILFLAAPASDYVHGTILPVDGGYLAR